MRWRAFPPVDPVFSTRGVGRRSGAFTAPRVLCAAPFYAVGEKYCAVFFGGEGGLLRGCFFFVFACFSPKDVCSSLFSVFFGHLVLLSLKMAYVPF